MRICYAGDRRFCTNPKTYEDVLQLALHDYDESRQTACHGWRHKSSDAYLYQAGSENIQAQRIQYICTVPKHGPTEPGVLKCALNACTDRHDGIYRYILPATTWKRGYSPAIHDSLLFQLNRGRNCASIRLEPGCRFRLVAAECVPCMRICMGWWGHIGRCMHRAHVQSVGLIGGCRALASACDHSIALLCMNMLLIDLRE